MKKVFLAVVVSLAAFCACDTYDDAPLRNNIKLLEERLTKIEQWSEGAKTELSSLQTIVLAMEGRDYIQSVELILEEGYEVGYVITFASGKVIKVWNGEKGRDGEDGRDGYTPVIGIAQDPSDPTDTNYYWTVQIGDEDPEFLEDAEGNKVPVGHTPLISVAEFEGALYWQIDGEWLLDAEGNKVLAKGTEGTSFFSAVDYTSDPDNVKFTLANGSTFSVRRAADEAQKVQFVESESKLVNGFYVLSEECDSIALKLNVSYADYSALTVKVYNFDEDNLQVVTKRVVADWQFAIAHKPFEDGESDANALIKFTSFEEQRNGDLAIVEVSLILASGETFTSSKIVKFFDSEEILSGQFTVNNESKKVKFSRGNLVLTNDGYSFAEGQQVLGGLFLESEVPASISVAGQSWVILSAEELNYLFILHNKTTLTVDGVYGYMVMPDGVAIPPSADYEALISLGGVFFPAAGFSNDSDRTSAGTAGYYLTSTSGKAVVFDTASIDYNSDIASTVKVSVRPVIVLGN